MQIADGRKTVAEIRDNAAERNGQLRSRNLSSSRDEETGVSSLDEAMQPKPGQKVITAEQHGWSSRQMTRARSPTKTAGSNSY